MRVNHFWEKKIREGERDREMRERGTERDAGKRMGEGERERRQRERERCRREGERKGVLGREGGVMRKKDGKMGVWRTLLEVLLEGPYSHIVFWYCTL